LKAAVFRVQGIDPFPQAGGFDLRPALHRFKALQGRLVPGRAAAVLDQCRAHIQACRFLLAVEFADGVGFQVAPLVPTLADLVVVGFVALPHAGRRIGHHRAIDQESGGKAVKPAPGEPLHRYGPLRLSFIADHEVAEPNEVVAGEFEVADAHQPAMGNAVIGRHRATGLLRHLRRQLREHILCRPEGLFPGHLPHEDSVLQCGDLDQRRRPESGDALVEDQRQQPDDHHQADGQGASGEPEHRLPVGQQRTGGALCAALGSLGGLWILRAGAGRRLIRAFRRKRMRTVSAAY
jgi:hypothetical protein